MQNGAQCSIVLNQLKMIHNYEKLLQNESKFLKYLKIIEIVQIDR